MATTQNRFSILDSIGQFPEMRTTKRQRQENSATPQYYEVYLLMKSLEPEKVLSRISIFGVQKGLEGITTQITRVSPQKSGELLILAKTKAAATKLINAKNLGGICKVECKEHPFLNLSKAKIYCPALIDLPEDEIKAGLEDQGVTEVRKIKKWKDGNLINTPLHILSYNCPEIPKYVKVGYLQIETTLYIPSPLRCTTCQKYGHGKKRCADVQGVATCGKCAEKITTENLHNNCNKAEKCANCSESHASYSRDCNVYKQEAEIIKIKTVDRISFQMARQKYLRTLNNLKTAAEKFHKPTPPANTAKSTLDAEDSCPQSAQKHKKPVSSLNKPSSIENLPSISLNSNQNIDVNTIHEPNTTKHLTHIPQVNSNINTNKNNQPPQKHQHKNNHSVKSTQPSHTTNITPTPSSSFQDTKSFCHLSQAERDHLFNE